MNKKTMTLILLTGLTVASYGEVRVSWMANAGFYFTADPSAGILGEATGHSTFAQLIYSVDLYADAADIGGTTTGDDVVWDTVNILEDGIANEPPNYDGYAWFGSRDYARAFVEGYVYARIFQDSDVGVGDWYFYTPMLALENITTEPPPPGHPQLIEMNIDMANGDAIDSGPTVAQVIPEPAAIGLIGLGGIITLTASRIRRRNAR